MKKTFCFNNCSSHSLRKKLSLSDLRISQVTSVQKGNLRNISQLRPSVSASKMRPSLGSLFHTLVTREKLKSDAENFSLRRGENNCWNKILIFLLHVCLSSVSTYVRRSQSEFCCTYHSIHCFITSSLKCFTILRKFSHFSLFFDKTTLSCGIERWLRFSPLNLTKLFKNAKSIKPLYQ